MSAPSLYPRSLAVRALTRVLSGHEPLDLVIEKIFQEEKLEASSRAWLQEVCSGTLRWKGRLDFVLDQTAIKKKPTGWLRKILLIAAYQLIVQDRTSPGAVVSETVNEVKHKEGDAPSRFANACLRKVSEHAELWRNLPIQDAASASLPEWWWKKLVAQRGLPWVQAYASATLMRPSLWLRTENASFEVGRGLSPGPLPFSWLDERGGSIANKEGFEEGKFIVQDISSQKLVSEIYWIVSEKFPQAQALDLCAAPGGKAIGLAWLGMKVKATDISDARLKLLSDTLARLKKKNLVETVSQAELRAEKLQFDLVWVDAPCSGSGIIRRHPDVRWVRKDTDLAELTRTQKQLLEEALRYVKPGGFLAYSVCSIFSDEGERAFRNFCEKSHLSVEREWFMEPQTEPFGDGFWAGLAKKG